MQIDFYQNFYKKRNSTKRPTVGGVGNLTEVHTVTGNLKEPCSILHPVISLQGQNPFPNNEPPDFYRYAYIPRFSRYYWVADWTWDNGVWVVTLDVDVLATYKPHIGEQSEYILRTDSTTDFNGEITDITYPATTDVQETTSALSNTFVSDITDGCYIVGIISGGSSQAVGAISYYAMTSAEFGALKNTLFSDDNLEIMHIIDSQGQTIVQDISQEVLKTMYNPYQYIASCMWFPFGKTAIPNRSPQTSINIGWWAYSLNGDRLYAQNLEFGREVYTIPPHPQASRGSYLNYAPYTRRTLIGRFGTVPIDTTLFKVGEQISISYMVDLITGQCYAKISVRNDSGQSIQEDLIAERNFMLAVPIQIAQVGTDYLGTAVSALNSVNGTFGSATTGFLHGGVVGAVTGAIAGVANGIYNTLQSAMPQVETSGQNGSFLASVNTTHVVEQFYKIVDEDIHHRGRPLCEVRRIDTLSGFILCAEGELELYCYDSERTEIETFLTSGFFWE